MATAAKKEKKARKILDKWCLDSDISDVLKVIIPKTQR